MRALLIMGVLAALLLPAGSSATNSNLVIYPANPFLTDDGVFVSAEGVVRLEHHSMSPVWFALEGLKTEAPVVAGDEVMVGSNAGLFALDIDTGMMRWHIPSSVSLNSPAVVGNYAFVSGADGSIRSVRLKGGGERWRRKLQGWLYPPAVSGEHLIVGGEKGTVWALDTEDGKELWKLTLKGPLSAPPAAADRESAYVCTAKGRLVAISAVKGRTKWEKQLRTPGSVLSDGKRVYVGQFDGTITARKTGNGAVIWKQRLPALGKEPLQFMADTIAATTAQGDMILLEPASGEILVGPGSDDNQPSDEARPENGDLVVRLGPAEEAPAGKPATASAVSAF